MLTCVNKIRAATVAAAAAGRWREALGRVARIRGSASPCGFSSGPKTARPSAVFCSGPRRPERTLARARTLARSSPGNAFRVPGGVLGKQRAFRLRLPPGREAGPAIVVSASIGEPHWPPQGGARQNRNCESIGTILSLSWKLLRAFDSRVSGVRCAGSACEETGELRLALELAITFLKPVPGDLGR